MHYSTFSFTVVLNSSLSLNALFLLTGCFSVFTAAMHLEIIPYTPAQLQQRIPVSVENSSKNIQPVPYKNRSLQTKFGHRSHNVFFNWCRV
jgi:hypothetical protein